MLDGPFAETKEQLLGFYVVECGSKEEALAIARELSVAVPHGAPGKRPRRVEIQRRERLAKRLLSGRALANRAGALGPLDVALGADRQPGARLGYPAASGVESVGKGVESLRDEVESLRKGVNSLPDGVKSLRKGVESLRKGVDSLDDGVESLRKAVKFVRAVLAQFSSSVDFQLWAVVQAITRASRSPRMETADEDAKCGDWIPAFEGSRVR